MTGTSARLLTLLSLLQARRDWPGHLLAERLEISERTVRRDVERLRELGYPIRALKGPYGGYRLEAGADLPPLLFDDEQAVALAVALRVATASGAGIGEASARALATVRQVMPSRLRHRIDTLQVSALDRTRARTETQVDTNVLIKLAEAVRAREVVRFDYSSAGSAGRDDANGPRPPRRVEPHHVVVRAGRWYLVGWDLDRGDWRIFRLDRIRPRTPNGPRFVARELPGEGGVDAFVSNKFKGSIGPEQWPCTGEVILDLPAATVVPFAMDALVEELGPQRCRLVVGSWSWAGVVAMISRYDAEFEVVSPVELRDEFARIADRFIRSVRHARESDPAGRADAELNSVKVSRNRE